MVDLNASFTVGGQVLRESGKRCASKLFVVAAGLSLNGQGFGIRLIL